MSKRRSASPKSSGRALAAGILLAAVVLGGLLVARRGAPSGPSALPESETAFSVSTHVGETAPPFTAMGVDGNPFAVTPGDGRAKVIVFYMGFG